MHKTKIDSNLTFHQAVAQNPDSLCPQDTFDSLGLLEVTYMGFDNKYHEGQIVVALSVMGEVEAFFKHALEMQFPIEKVIPAAHPTYAWDDEKLMTDNISSGFNYRLIAGTNKPSLHGQGLAFDINPRQNPYMRYENDRRIIRPKGARWKKDVPGTLHTEHPLVLMMEGFGWEWGGNWKPENGRVDYQHFEKQQNRSH